MSELAGTLRQELRVLRAVAGTDVLGAPAGDRVEVARVWAALRPEPGRPPAMADGVAVRPRWRVTLRPCALRPGDRLAGGGAELIVRHVRRDPALPDRIVVDAEEVR